SPHTASSPKPLAFVFPLRCLCGRRLGYGWALCLSTRREPNNRQRNGDGFSMIGPPATRAPHGSALSMRPSSSVGNNISEAEHIFGRLHGASPRQAFLAQASLSVREEVSGEPYGRSLFRLLTTVMSFESGLISVSDPPITHGTSDWHDRQARYLLLTGPDGQHDQGRFHSLAAARLSRLAGEAGVALAQHSSSFTWINCGR